MPVGCADHATAAPSAAVLSLDTGWYLDEQIQLAEIYDTDESSEGASSERVILSGGSEGSPENCSLHSASLEGTESGSVASVYIDPPCMSASGVETPSGRHTSCTRVAALPYPRMRPNPRLWDIRTPFMMDQQAEREARRLETAGGVDEESTAAQRRRRRREHAAAAEGRGEEEVMVMERLVQLLEQRRRAVEAVTRTSGCFCAGVGAVGDSAARNIDKLGTAHTESSEPSAMGDSAGVESSDTTADGVQRKSERCADACDESGRAVGSPSTADYRLNNRPAREAARYLLDRSSPPEPPFWGVNDTDSRQLVSVQGRSVVLPPRCRFLCDDVTAAFDDVSVAERLLAGGDGFDCVVLDPPWTNKFVRRKRKHSQAEGYPCLDAASLRRLPVRRLAAPGALVAVWCTNKAAHLATLRDVLFPAWGVSEVTTWYWVKVTRHGAPVTSGGRHSKLPYERLLLGRTGPRPSAPPIQPHRLIVSVPCALHSRKPLLNGLLRPYLPAGHHGLEVFARSLLPGWTAWGDQVLMLQQPGTLLLPRGDADPLLLPRGDADPLLLPRGDPDTLLRPRGDPKLDTLVLSHEYSGTLPESTEYRTLGSTPFGSQRNVRKAVSEMMSPDGNDTTAVNAT